MANKKKKDNSKKQLSETKRKKVEEVLRESEEHTRIFASYQHAISQLREFYITEASFEQMLQKTVNLLVKSFGYYMAWYGELKADEKVIIPKVWAGKYEKYLDGLRLELDDSKDAKCAMSLAIVRKKPFGYADLEHDKDFAKWRPLALQYGYRSNQAIPLIIEGKSIGAFLIYSRRPRAFSEILIRYLAGIVNELTTIVEKTTESKKIKAKLNSHQEHLEEIVRKRTTELSESQEKWRSLVQNIPDVIMTVARDGTILAINHTVKGLTIKGTVGKKIYDYTPPESIKIQRKSLQKVFRTGNPDTYQLLGTGPSGPASSWYETRTVPIKRGKQVRAATLICRDITESKKIGEAIRQEAEQWNRTFNSISDFMFIQDKDFRFVKVNKAFYNAVKAKPEDLIGKKCYETLHKSDKPWPNCPLAKTLKDKKPHIEEVHDPNIGIPLLISTSPLFDERRKITGAVHIAKDITERKQAEEKLKKAYDELKKAQAQLIQSEKMAAIGQLATGVVHEINSPLTAILGETEMLLKKKQKVKETKDTLKIIAEQGERIKTITQRLLEFSQKKTLSQELLDVNNALKESFSLLNYQAKIENIKIINKLHPHLPKIFGDKNQIQEVFLNIMLNAVQAMEKGGRLTIKTYGEKITGNGKKKTDIFKQGQRIVVIEFEDTGEGMNKETLRKIFDPFFSTRKMGTGLGLPICYRIIQNHNGVIEVHSKLGEGSTFIIKLPIPKGGGG